MVLVIGFISIAIALWAGTIYKLAMVAWSILLIGLFAPFAFGMYWKKANKSGAIAALVGGFVAWVVLGIFYYHTSTYAICEADFECAFWDAVYISSFPAFIISAVLQVVVSLATQKIGSSDAVDRCGWESVRTETATWITLFERSYLG
jgi:Na+/proline symporter